jgi:hypothetical protein
MSAAEERADIEHLLSYGCFWWRYVSNWSHSSERNIRPSGGNLFTSQHPSKRSSCAFFKTAVAVSLLMFIRPDNMFREATVCSLVADMWTRLAA